MKTGAQGCKKKRRQRGDSVAAHSCLMGDCREDRDTFFTAYGIGLLVTFVALALMQMGQPALLYLVPCTLLTSFVVALWRRELAMFWTGSGFAKDLPQPPVVIAPVNCPQLPKDSSVPASQQDTEQMTNPTLHVKELHGPASAEEELADTSTKTDQSEISVAHSEEPAAQNKDDLESKCLNAEQNQLE